MAKKERLDTLLVEKGLETSRSRAHARILAGEVVVNDHLVDKPGTKVLVDANIRFKSNSIPYVSRGGLKLKAAIDKWPSNIANAICLDVGASTGGFTDVLLKEGAKLVYAVDVGHNQLHWSLQTDERVKNLERTHIGKLEVGTLEPRPTIVVVDVSFISLTKVLQFILPHLAPEATMYALIKPQFEVGRGYIEKGGIVRDDKARSEAVNMVLEFAKSLKLQLLGHEESPITGADGNIEYVAAFNYKA